LLEKRRERRKMKKVVTLSAISLLFLTFLVLPTHAAVTKLYVSPLSYTAGKVGKMFTINVTVAGVANLYGFDFKLSYNTTLLDAKTIDQGAFFPGSPKSHVLKNQINDTGGYVWFAVTLLAPEPAKSGSGIIATITFNTTYGTTYPQTVGCDLHLYDTTLADLTVQPITHDTIDGYYAFVSILGDINGDGTVDIFDVVILAAAFGSRLGDPNWDSRADLNGDNDVDIFDAVILALNFGKAG